MTETGRRTRAGAEITVHKYELSVHDEPAEGPVLPRNSPRHPTRKRTPSDAESAVGPTSGRSQITSEED